MSSVVNEAYRRLWAQRVREQRIERARKRAAERPDISIGPRYFGGLTPEQALALQAEFDRMTPEQQAAALGVVY